MSVINKRYDFVYIFDVENGNPNGDPDAGNMPRLDPETGYGLVTDVCLKRKVRNYVELKNKNKAPFEIYVREKAVLNDQHERAHKATGAEDDKEKNKRKGSGDEVVKARKWMCENFYDVRTFGAVMSLGINCGQVRGPVQFSFARSVDPIMPLEISITRMAVATKKEAEDQSGDNRTMGKKHIIPYGLYRAEGFVSAFLANGDNGTGFNDKDLDLLWESLINMFEHDHSAARGKMSARKLVVFQHENELGSAPSHTLFESVTIKRIIDQNTPARKYSDYKVEINRSVKPKGIEILEKL